MAAIALYVTGQGGGIMAYGKFVVMAVLKRRDPFIPVVGVVATGVCAGYKSLLTINLKSGLKGIAGISFFLFCDCSIVNQENRD
jgi:hypothetical protein